MGERSCKRCELGRFVATQNATSCQPVPKGHIPQAGASSSARVAPGWRINQTCVDLEYTSKGEYVCEKPSIECKAGTIGNETAATNECTRCALGQTSVKAEVKCSDCPKGKYGVMKNPTDPGPTCQDCPFDYYRSGGDDEPKTSCTVCPTGYYTSQKKGESSCSKNGLSPEDCGTTMFLNNRNANFSTCERCPRGGECNETTEWKDVVRPANESRIKALFGWSRCSQDGATSVEHMFERCPFAAACLGSPNAALEDKFEGGMALKNHPEGCNKAYRNASHNFLCFNCAAGYSHASGGVSGRCDKCPPPGENAGIAIVGILLGLFALSIYVKLTLGDSGSKSTADGIKSIGLSFVQTISLLTTFPIAWPAMFTAVFQIGGAVTVLGQHLVNLKCMFPERSEAEVLYTSQILWALIPLVLAGASVASWLVIDALCSTSKEKKKKEETLRQKISATVVALLYLIWPSLCSVVFSLFACRSFCGDKSAPRLRADIGEFCFRGRHASFAFGLGVPMLLLYVLGLPVIGLFMVSRLRWRAVQKNMHVQRCKGHKTWGVLYSVFDDNTWWYVDQTVFPCM